MSERNSSTLALQNIEGNIPSYTRGGSDDAALCKRPVVCQTTKIPRDTVLPVFLSTIRLSEPSGGAGTWRGTVATQEWEPSVPSNKCILYEGTLI